MSLPRKSMVESAFSRLGFSGRQGLSEDQVGLFLIAVVVDVTWRFGECLFACGWWG